MALWRFTVPTATHLDILFYVVVKPQIIQLKILKLHAAQLEQVGVTQRMVVDFSHGNSEKEHKNQLNVADSIMAQLRSGSTAIAGIMAESFMIEGNQKVVKDEPLVYGQSITDACLHWADSEKLLRDLAQASKERKALLAL